VDVTTITGWGLVTFTFSGAEQYVMSNGTHYCITVEYDSGDAGKYLYYGHDAAFLTHQGNSLYNVGSWNAYTPRDMCFYVYGDPLTTPGITIAGRKVRVVTNTDVTPTTALTIDSSQNALFAAKAIFTQSDGNEYIDSLNDAYLDYGATTGHRFRINGTEQINLIDGVLAPKTDSDVDLGTSALYFKNLYIDSITTTGTILASDKVIFTQTDGNEYIDSLADGYMNYGATTGHRFNSDILLNGDNRKICFGTGEASDSYIHYDGSEIDILSAGAINLEPGTSLEIGGVAGWSGWFDDGTNFRVTVTKGLITAVDNSTAGGHNP
jgi:DNA-dependent RNA polymerase auxiliary subunit epsilon